ncbi:hypothetical protein BY996DRAFT_6434022 [Phakopsora pachyrhizi]|nr:hypothetical protein BY996DRAFT_6434022 [Phakopsora pachyrhizi]
MINSGLNSLIGPSTILTSVAQGVGSVPPGKVSSDLCLHQLKQGNWFQTQLAISLLIGSLSFLTFCYSRSRSTLTFAPRTHLSSHRHSNTHSIQNSSSGLLSWIIPTLKTPEREVLKIAGLDAVALLYFFKLGFYYFLTCTIFAFAILVPINIHENGTTEGVPPDPPPSQSQNSSSEKPHVDVQSFIFLDLHPRWSSLIGVVSIYHTTHLLFTYFFTFVLLKFLRITYNSCIALKPIFNLANCSSAPLRTVMIEHLPLHLRNDSALFEYFNEVLGMGVESAVVVKDVGSLVKLLDSRTKALLSLERAWTKWLGLEDDDISSQVITDRKRPTYRPSWLSLKQVDLIDHLTAEFQAADDLVRRRRSGKFRCMSSGFVTMKNFIDAQTVAQVIHWPKPEQANITLAPEPRDVYWSNLNISTTSLKIRNATVLFCMALLYGFWATPVSFLANLMSYESLKSLLGIEFVKLIEKSPTLKALLQNSLPTLAIIIFNALLPFLLEWLCTLQGFKSKSLIEYSLMKKYHLFLLITVLLIFVAVSTVSLLQEIRESPGQLIDKIARSLPGARFFFASYLMLQSLAIIPLQLLQLPNQITQIFYRFHSEMKNMSLEALCLGNVYPQALMAFTICITYSVIAPVILVFGMTYFGMAYLVYKYKVLNVYCRRIESQGRAWPIACNRIGWGMIIFQVFMLGLLSLRQAFMLSTLVIPLIMYTIHQITKLHSVYRKHSKFVPLSQIRECLKDRDREVDEEIDGKADNCESQVSSVFTGVLDTGNDQYSHPASE